MPSFKHQLLVTQSLTLAAAMVGAMGGLGVGRLITLRDAQQRLNLFAERIRKDADASATEAREVLGRINHTPYAQCSTQQLQFIRSLVYHSEFLKDAGKMADGKIECSATLGNDESRSTRYQPQFSRPDGSKIYRNLEPFKVQGQNVIALQIGSSFVVYSPFTLGKMASPGLHFTVTDLTNPFLSGVTGETPPERASILVTEGKAKIGNTLYSTRCSAAHFNCVTAYASLDEAVAMHRRDLVTSAFIGGLLGAILGLFFSSFYIRRVGIEKQLRRAIRRAQLSVVYQPIVCLADGKIIGAEALARWTDEDQLSVGPDVFIKIAEERGFVGEITALVIHCVLRDFRDVMRTTPAFHISVNIAAADLTDEDFVPMLQLALTDAAVVPASLAIEITEGSTARQQAAIETIAALRRRGHSVHIDDFGTGYSSLAYLHELSVNAIKIDRAFTRTIGTEAVTASILPQIIAMAKSLQLQVIVEGIETEEQARYCSEWDQNVLGQGWFYGRPVGADELRRRLAENWNRPLPVAPVANLEK